MSRISSRAVQGRAVVPALVMLTLLLLAGMAVALTGWSMGSPSGENDDPLVSPTYYTNPLAVCSLLGSQDFELVLGDTFQQGVALSAHHPAFAQIPGITKCGYLSEDETRVVALGVVYAYADQLFDDAKQRAKERKGLEGVEAVGSEAFFDRVSGELLVLTDDKVVGVIVSQGYVEADRDRIERARRLAEKAMERLR